MADEDVNPSTFIQPCSVHLSYLEVVPNMDAESVRELEVLSVGYIVSNISIKEPINFNNITVSEHKHLCEDLGLHLEQENLGFVNVDDFYDGLPSQTNFKRGGNVSLWLDCAYKQVPKRCMLTLG